MGLRRHARHVAEDEAPHHALVVRVRRGGKVEEHGEGDRHVDRRRRAGMDVPDRVAEALVLGLAGIGGEEREIVVDRARDDVEIEPLRRPRLLEHEQRQAFRRGIGQPLVDGEAVALRLRDLLAVLVEEELVVEAVRRIGAEHPADLARQLHRVDQVLARHLVVDAERRPAERPVGLPLALDAAAGDRLLDELLRVRDRDRRWCRRRASARGSRPGARRRWSG